MEYTERFNKTIIGMRFAMIAFAIATVIIMFTNGWSIPNFLLFIINAANFALFQFTNQKKLICAMVCIFLGILANIIALNIVAIMGVVLIILGIIYIYYSYKSRN